MKEKFKVGFKVGSLVDPYYLNDRLVVYRWGVEKRQGGEGITWEVRDSHGDTISPGRGREILTLFWNLERLGTESAIGFRWTRSGKIWRENVREMRMKRAKHAKRA